MTSDEQFEAWFASKFPKINDKASDPTDPVRGQVKEVARYAWKYSREAIEIELPQRWSVDGFESGWVADSEGANLDYAETVKVIEAAGLKVKPC